MIYAVHILDRKFVKIGFTASDDVQERISQLQTGNPYFIEPILTVDGSLIQEKELHKTLVKAFTRIRIPIPPNEWYPGKNPFFKGFLDHLKHGANTGLMYLDQYDQSVKQPGKNMTSLEPNLKWP